MKRSLHCVLGEGAVSLLMGLVVAIPVDTDATCRLTPEMLHQKGLHLMASAYAKAFTVDIIITKPGFRYQIWDIMAVTAD